MTESRWLLKIKKVFFKNDYMQINWDYIYIYLVYSGGLINFQINW